VELDDNPPVDPTGPPKRGKPRRPFPYRYAQRSLLEVEVPEGQAEVTFDFKLTWR
jgi:hypothetical protein